MHIQEQNSVSNKRHSLSLYSLCLSRLILLTRAVKPFLTQETVFFFLSAESWECYRTNLRSSDYNRGFSQCAKMGNGSV